MATTRMCDHKSAGMLVWRDENLLLIERKTAPFGLAPPAGHLDGDDSFEKAAKRELKEEVGLETKGLQLLIEGRKDNPCHRENGSWHYWKIYDVDAVGEVQRSTSETKQVVFCTKHDLQSFARRTEEYLRGDIRQDDWETTPGLEPVWCEWLKQLGII